MSTSTLHLGIFYMPQICDMGPKEGVLRIFSPLKNPTASAGFEPANLGTKGQHATPRPPKPLLSYLWQVKCKNTWKCIGRRGPVKWPPGSPDLSSLDFFCSAILNRYVCHNLPQTVRAPSESIPKKCVKSVWTQCTVAETTRRQIYNYKTFQEFEFENRLQYASV